jgi:hypothetical protein
VLLSPQNYVGAGIAPDFRVGPFWKGPGALGLTGPLRRAILPCRETYTGRTDLWTLATAWQVKRLSKQRSKVPGQLYVKSYDRRPARG